MFKKIFKKEYESKFFSPGRINILGEHIDYNGGFCLPMAINKGTYAYVGKNDEKKFKIYSSNFPEEGVYEIELNTKEFYSSLNGWSNIFRGLKNFFNSKHKFDFGLDIVIEGEIPTASGLSSSASLSMLFVFILNDYYDFSLSMMDMILICQKMENTFLGANSGILDQYIIGNGRRDCAMLLDTSVPSHQYFSSNFGNNVFLIIATNKKRQLNESKYNERVMECHSAKTKLNERGYKIKHLCELKESDLADIEKLISSKTIFKRVKHCVEEQVRTIKASRQLENPSILGQLLFEGHESMRDLYEATGEHLDFIYDFAKTKKYVLGARMNGAGFGGSGITLLPHDKINEYKEEFESAYYEKFGIKPTFIIARSSDGVHKC